LDPPTSSTGGSIPTNGEEKAEQLFYKLANLDDRIKNADQVRQKAELGTV
jgi:hypothetical protein